jgi:hypothetical protein
LSVSEASRSGIPSRLSVEYGYRFIERFIQVPFQVPRPTANEVRRLVDFFGAPATAESAVAPAATRRYAVDVALGKDSVRVRQIVQMVAPALDDNPRRIKQFLSVFRLRAYIASNTGLFAESQDPAKQLTLEQLGKFTALAVRWPSLIYDLANMPALLWVLEVVAEGHPVPEDFTNSPQVAYWRGKPQLLALLRANLDQATCSLANVDVLKLLSVSPRRPQLFSTSGSATMRLEASGSATVVAPQDIEHSAAPTPAGAEPIAGDDEAPNLMWHERNVGTSLGGEPPPRS